jgi:hypothetical protein
MLYRGQNPGSKQTVRIRVWTAEILFYEANLSRVPFKRNIVEKEYKDNIFLKKVSAHVQKGVFYRHSSTKVSVFTELFPIERNSYLCAEDLCVKMREALAGR